jgi:hypothetical protein
MANTWVIIGVVAGAVIVAGIVRSHTAWAAFAILPGLIDAALFRSALSLRRPVTRRHGHPDTSDVHTG